MAKIIDSPIISLLYRNLTPVSTAADTAEHDLMSHTCVAGSFNGKNGYRLFAQGNFGIGGGTKTLRFDFDGSTPVIIVSNGDNTRDWICRVHLFSTGPSTQQYIIEFTEETKTTLILTGNLTINDTVDFTCKFTGQNNSANSAFTQSVMLVEYVSGLIL